MRDMTSIAIKSRERERPVQHECCNRREFRGCQSVDVSVRGTDNWSHVRQDCVASFERPSRTLKPAEYPKNDRRKGAPQHRRAHGLVLQVSKQ